MVLRTLLFKFTLKFIITYLPNDVNERLIIETFDYIIILTGFFSDRVTLMDLCLHIRSLAEIHGE